MRHTYTASDDAIIVRERAIGTDWGPIAKMIGSGLTAHLVRCHAVEKGLPGAPSAPFWNADTTETLRALWAAGDLSASQIGASMNISKTKVMSKIHRLGLAGRPDPIIRNAPAPTPIRMELPVGHPISLEAISFERYRQIDADIKAELR